MMGFEFRLAIAQKSVSSSISKANKCGVDTVSWSRSSSYVTGRSKTDSRGKSRTKVLVIEETRESQSTKG